MHRAVLSVLLAGGARAQQPNFLLELMEFNFIEAVASYNNMGGLGGPANCGSGAGVSR